MTITETHFADRVKHIPESFIREILKVATQPQVISFAGGLPNPDFFPVEKLASAAEKVLARDGKIALQYAPTEGYLPLRDYIAQRQSQLSGQKLATEDVLILNGSQQGLDLIGKLFLNPGSSALLEAPSYLGAIQAFSAYQPLLYETLMEDGGPDLHFLKKFLEKNDPTFFYCIPNFQNPTGNMYDMHHRHGVAYTFQTTNTIIVEDNPYSDIYFEKTELPDLYSMMPSRTVQLGSFSKIISPGLRLGWAIAPATIIRKMTIAKQASDLHSSNLGQRILYQFLVDNSLENHLLTIREFYKKQAHTMEHLLKLHFPTGITWTQPKGGMFIWIILPEHLDANTLLTEAIQQNVIFVPGQHFFINSAKGKNTIRMNFSNPSIAEMKKGITVMASIINKELNK
jgi:2-aminoadipate transaminase